MTDEPQLTVRRTDEPGRELYSVIGELDLATREILRDATANATCDIVLDFAGVTFCDSGSIGVLIALQQQLSPMGHRLDIINVSSTVFRVFEVMGLVDALCVQCRR